MLAADAWVTAISLHRVDRRLLARPRTYAHVANVLAFGVLPAMFMVPLLRERGLGWDFRAFYLGAHAYLAGASPYPSHSLAALATKQGFVYPAPMAALFAPFAVLPYSLALAIWLCLSVLAIALALRVLGVEDWRCFGALFLTHPVQQAVRLGTLMPVLMLLLALLWKYRDRVWPAAVLAAVLAVSKLFLLPMLLWLAATHRLRAAVAGGLIGLAACVVGWLPIHLSTIAAYPSLLQALAAYEQTFSYSLTSFGVALGLSSADATALAIGVGAGTLAAMWALRRNDLLAFRLALAASFVLCPIVWGHYYVLLVVPLAIGRRRLSAMWFAAAWISPDTLQLHTSVAWVALALVVLIAQLDLAPPVSRWWSRHPRARMRQVLAVTAAAGLLVASSATADVGQTDTGALRAASRRTHESGVASVRWNRMQRQLCWRLWTQDLPTGRAYVTLQSAARSEIRLHLLVRLRTDGGSQGCVLLDRTQAELVQRMVSRSHHYRLSVQARDVPSVVGVLANP